MNSTHSLGMVWLSERGSFVILRVAARAPYYLMVKKIHINAGRDKEQLALTRDKISELNFEIKKRERKIKLLKDERMKFLLARRELIKMTLHPNVMASIRKLAEEKKLKAAKKHVE